MVVSNINFVEQMEEIKTNPLAVQRLMIEALEASLGGEQRLLNPTSPFVFLMEGAVSIGTSGMQQSASLNRLHYPRSANTHAELFHHMSDDDFIDVFSTPSRTSMTLILGIDEIVSRGREVPGSNGTRRIIIPKHSAIYVANLPFTMQYPIIIDITNTGIIKCYMDTSKTSPVQKIPDNNLTWDIRRIEGIRCISITFPIVQVELTTTTIDVSVATVVKKIYSFPDMYYYCRIHMRRGNEWVEVKTTHSNEVYDPTITTALLTIANNNLTIEIPQIYMSKGMITDTLRVDIYTTKGYQDISLGSYPTSAFTYKWQDLDASDSLYYAPLSNFNNIALISTATVTGGSRGLTFTELRDRVINRSQTKAGLPITDRQVGAFVNNMGYGLVTLVDNLTDRTFLATRESPIPRNGVTITGGDLSVHTLRINTNTLRTFDSVNEHTYRYTITPKMLYSTSNGILSPVLDSALNTLLDPTVTPPEAVANFVNANDYLFSPFYYVLDVSDTSFGCRIYNLDYPSITNIETNNTNPSLNIKFSLLGSTIEKTDEGYLLIIEYDPRSDIKNFDVSNIYPQISYSIGGGARGFINGNFYGTIANGKPVDDIYKWSFDINTNYDVNTNDQLVLTPNNFPVNLISDFDIITIVSDYFPQGTSYSDLDSITNVTTLDGYTTSRSYIAAARDTLTIKFGNRLTHMWNRTRTVTEAIEFETYPATIFLTAEEDIPVLTGPGIPSVKVNQTTGEPYIEIAIKKGEFILDNDGNKIPKFKKDSVIKDEYGQPKIKGGINGILREIDLVLLDGAYYFANDELTTGYLEEASQRLSDWSSTEMQEIEKYLLPKTEIFFYPKVSSGTIPVLSHGSIYTEINAKQTLTFTFYVSKEIKKSTEIQEIINDTTKGIVSNYFKQSILAKSELIKLTEDGLGDNVKGISIRGFLDDAYDIVSMVDDSVRPSIGKSLQALSNMSLRVNDTINFEYIEH